MGEDIYMKQDTARVLIPMLYLFCPFVYIALYLDYTKGTMLGYVLMMFGSILVTFLTMFISDKINVFIGNMYSFMLSFVLLYNVHLTNDWHIYYTPVETNQTKLFIVLSILIVIPQLFVIKYMTKYLDKDKVITK